LLGWICPDGTQSRQGSPDAPDATRCGVLVQDAQDAQDAGSRLGESGRNTTGSDAGHLFADVALHHKVVLSHRVSIISHKVMLSRKVVLSWQALFRVPQVVATAATLERLDLIDSTKII